ncbi:unnamed protein product [Peronospora effusa]|nr:unnamed protein product [Peronospora effusa]
MMHGLCAPVRLVPRLRVSRLHPFVAQRSLNVMNHQYALLQSRVASTDKDIETSHRRQYISLYNYTPLDKTKLPKLRREMNEQWEKLGIVGRIYIAEEGINGQLVVPEQVVTVFERSFPRLLCNAKLFYGQLIEDKALRNASKDRVKPAEPFCKLDVRVRNQILHDGFQGGELNLQNSGRSLPPEQWHHKLKIRNDLQDSDILVLDVRNFYEHEIGRFDGATRIMVDTFRDTFDALDEILEQHAKKHDGQKPKEIMMYCTGGIRCEKVGAYLTQYKGISNVQKLHGGIVNYVHFLKEQRQAATRARARCVNVGADTTTDDGNVKEVMSLFRGKNFVFDQRCVGDLTESEEVTDDVLGQCFQCAEPCNRHTNCSNVMCHGLILQCLQCARSMVGACSQACMHEFVKMESMTLEDQRNYRKENALKWKPKNPNSASALKFIRFRPASLELLTNA